MNSIRAAISSPISIVATIANTLRSPFYKTGLLVVVEGDDDKQFYEGYFDANKVNIIPMKGSMYCAEIIQALNPKYERNFILIKDADFDHVDHVSYPFKNMFLTDFHDIEMMIFDDDIACRICKDYIGHEDVTLLSQVIQDIKPLSYIKWYNKHENLRLNFKMEFGVSYVYDGQNQIDEDYCINILNSTSCNQIKQGVQIADLMNFISANSSVDTLQISNGHDICDGLCIAIKHKRRCNIPKVGIWDKGLKYYQRDKFYSTILYNRISSWLILNNYNVLVD